MTLLSAAVVFSVVPSGLSSDVNQEGTLKNLVNTANFFCWVGLFKARLR